MFHAFPKRLTASLLVILLVLSLVFVAAIQFGAGTIQASAHSAIAQSTIPHIFWSPSKVDNNPTFSATLKGRGFPSDDIDPILVQLDATLGGVCASATFSTPVTNSDGNWSTVVHFVDCHAGNNILASAVDDHHLNHATLHIN